MDRASWNGRERPPGTIPFMGRYMCQFSRRQYAERRKTELYDELDDEDEDDIILAAHSASSYVTTSRFQDYTSVCGNHAGSRAKNADVVCVIARQGATRSVPAKEGRTPTLSSLSVARQLVQRPH